MATSKQLRNKCILKVMELEKELVLLRSVPDPTDITYEQIGKINDEILKLNSKINA